MDSCDSKDAVARSDHSESEMPSRFMRMNLAAFQILLVKFLFDVTRSKDKFRSCPGVVPEAERLNCHGLSLGEKLGAGEAC